MGLFDKLFGRGGAEDEPPEDEEFNVTVVDGRVQGDPVVMRDVQVSQEVRIFHDGVEITDPAEKEALLEEKRELVRESLADAHLPEDVGAMVTDALRSAFGDVGREPPEGVEAEHETERAKPLSVGGIAPPPPTLARRLEAAQRSGPPAPAADAGEAGRPAGRGPSSAPEPEVDESPCDAGIEAPEAPQAPEAPEGY